MTSPTHVYSVPIELLIFSLLNMNRRPKIIRQYKTALTWKVNDKWRNKQIIIKATQMQD